MILVQQQKCGNGSSKQVAELAGWVAGGVRGCLGVHLHRDVAAAEGYLARAARPSGIGPDARAERKAGTPRRAFRMRHNSRVDALDKRGGDGDQAGGRQLVNDAKQQDRLAARGLDVTVPNVARIYDYILGRKIQVVHGIL